MTDFNLRAEIRHVLDTTDMTDPGEVAEKVIGAIPSEDLVAALRVTLRPYVANLMGTERISSITQISRTDQTLHGGQSSTVGAGQTSDSSQFRNDDQTGPAAAGTNLDRGESGQPGDGDQTSSAAPPRSWKREGIRDLMRCRMPGQNKLLGDCTIADITAAAVEREALSRKNRAWAERYRKLARRMSQFHVDTVRELSYETVAAILRGDAA